MGSALGLVGPVSVYCDWVRWKVWSAASISVWQHVKLSVQIRPWDTLACCWDVKQPTNKQKMFVSCVDTQGGHSAYRLVGLVVRPPRPERQTWVWSPLESQFVNSLQLSHCLTGLVVEVSASKAAWSPSSHTSDKKIGTYKATLPGAWRYRVSAGTGWSSVSMLTVWVWSARLGETVWSAASISVW